MLPRKSDFTLKMLWMHHIFPNRYIHPSGGLYSWLFLLNRSRRQPNHQTLPRYLSYSTLYDNVKNTKKWYPPRGLPTIWSRIPIEMIDRGAAHGWLKIKTACSNFRTGKSKRPSLKKRKVSEKTEIYRTKLDNELNGNVKSNQWSINARFNKHKRKQNKMQ